MKMKTKYFRKDFSLFIVDIMHFIALLACWLVIWSVSGLTLTNWKGFALFIAVLIMALSLTIRNFVQDKIKEKYGN